VKGVYALILVAAASVPFGSDASLAVSVPTKTMTLGSTFIVTGRTGTATGTTLRAVGVVVVRGRWNGGRWHVITTTHTDRHGRYRLTVKARRRGVLSLRITPPDRQDKRFVLRVL
jgi:5-hydroxyisourate hydrolase-like protein (transthyretin family)